MSISLGYLLNNNLLVIGEQKIGPYSHLLEIPS
jgi:hypothetical protein